MGWKMRKDKLQSDQPDAEATQDDEFQEPEQEIEADASAMARLARLSEEPDGSAFVLDLNKDSFRTDTKRTSLDPSEFAWFNDPAAKTNGQEKPRTPAAAPIASPAYQQPSFDPTPFTPAPPPPYNRADYQSAAFDPDAVQQIPAYDTSSIGLGQAAQAAPATIEDRLQWSGPRPSNGQAPFALEEPVSPPTAFDNSPAFSPRPAVEQQVRPEPVAPAQPAWAQETAPAPPVREAASKPTPPPAFADPGPAFGAPVFDEPASTATPASSPFASPAFAEPAPSAPPAFAESGSPAFGTPAFADPEPAAFSPAFADPAPAPFESPAFAEPDQAPFGAPSWQQNGKSSEPAWAQQPPQAAPPPTFNAPPQAPAQQPQSNPASPPKAPESPGLQYAPSSTQSPYASQPSRPSNDGQNINSFSRDSVAAGLVTGEGELSIPKVAPFIVAGAMQQEEVVTTTGDHYLILRIRNLSSSYKLTKDVTTIGRPDSPTKNYPDIEIDLDDGVSRKHAEIRLKASQYYVVDVGSTNGTLLNGELMEVNLELKLAHGDRIRVGEKTEIVFE